MGRVIYSAITSLDGYIEDADGHFEFAMPPEDVHLLANEEARQASAFLFGRRLFEVMEEPWTTAATRDDLPEIEAEFARGYVATPRIVFSDTLESAPAGVRLVRSGDAVAEVTRLKREMDGELVIGGAGVATSLLGVVDELRLYSLPVVIGVGKPFIAARTELRLRLLEQRGLASGAMYLRYEPMR